MYAYPDRFDDIPDVFYGLRLRQLASDGLLSAQGNLRRMRFSEVRKLNYDPNAPSHKSDGQLDSARSFPSSNACTRRRLKTILPWHTLDIAKPVSGTFLSAATVDLRFGTRTSGLPMLALIAPTLHRC